MTAKVIVIAPSVDVMTTQLDMSKMIPNIEAAGRTCYKSEHKMDESSAPKFVRKIIKNGHHSVLEHASVTVRFICSRSTSHQLVRHRIGSYSQESQRYCNYGKTDALHVIAPKQVLSSYGHKMGQIFSSSGEMLEGGCAPWLNSCINSYANYLLLLEKGWKPEDAREVLPNCTKTEVVTTYNLRQWRWFFEKRCDKHAQSQIRFLSKQLLCELNKYLGPVFEDQYAKFIAQE